MRLLTAATILALIALSGAAADDPKEVAKKLEGIYEVIEAITGGKPVPEATTVEKFVIKDGEIIVKIKGSDREETAKFILDPSQNPAHIDIVPTNNDKERVVKGIYMFKETDKGLELTIAFADGNPKGAQRPKDFRGAGEDEMVIKLFRKKK